ncbi:alpha/beta hydrolase [Pseudobutyrivibrio xylanivorans]|uniref:Carboxyl/acetyl esterase n=1 Tax=Pseudobutyrivibrio xylanivorans TaxID=185007 RepID=A0A5P6VUA6_PSEXY|nr:alpha/beta hydrolase fold domain-containing protein [Pseudobutyrivibrio xylanivorans]QFJ55339.1 carboxyl/acetyl esterase [Pseudobutyrivibrio xylanivorans]
MSFQTFMFKYLAGKNDKKRDAKLVVPENITMERDINYLGNNDPDNLLDIYYEKHTERLQPTIISIHGGGYIYGSKEIYKHYCAYLASLGFTVVNFNYHLAPKAKFPSQLTEINQVMEWIAANAEEHFIDINNVFLVGDSAGAQMCSHYAAIFTNPEFEKLFDFKTPQSIKIRAIALNCGIYEFTEPSQNDQMGKLTKDLHDIYLGKHSERWDDHVNVLGHITENFPPSYVMTAYYDFLRGNAEPMHNFLKKKGVDTEFKCYGKEGQTYMEHVCHVNMNLDEAKQINQDEVEFFKRYIV